jgi:beta-lactamase regulating signal transducer with metallopeptidase domain
MNPPAVVRDVLTQIFLAQGWAQLVAKTTLLLAVAWLLQFSLARSNPRWRRLLWRAAACGLTLFAVCAAGIPGLEICIGAPQQAAVIPTAAQPPAAPGDTALSDFGPPLPGRNQVAGEIGLAAPIARTEIQPEAVQPAAPARAPIPSSFALLTVWACGAALLAMRLLVAMINLSRLLGKSQPAVEEIAAEVARVAAALGCRRKVAVRISASYAVPFQYGLFRPVLVLPEPMCRADYGGQRPGIIAHELAHVMSWDFHWNLVMQIVSATVWFHPLAWRIASAHRAACDEVCDAVSAYYLGDLPAYCRTLAQVALRGAASFPTLGLAMARSCDVRRRIGLLQRRLFAAGLSRRAVGGAAIIALPMTMLLAGVRFAPAEPISMENSAQVFAVAKENPDGQAAAATAPDLYGDLLPPGAIARLGTVRYRSEHGDTPEALAFSDDKSVVALTWDFRQLRSSLRWWNLADGKLVRTVRPVDIAESRVFAHPLAGAITPDGKIAAAWIGGYHLPPGGGKPFPRSWIKWWEVQTGRELASIPCDDGRPALPALQDALMDV